MSNKVDFTVTYNPYRDGPHPVDNSSSGTPSFNGKDRILEIWEKTTSTAVDFLARYELTNFEKQVDAAGLMAGLADKAVFFTLFGLQIESFVNQCFSLGLQSVPYLNLIPKVLQIVAQPVSFFFIGVGVIQGIMELVQIRRTVEVLNVLQQGKTNNEKKEWLKAHYFELLPCEEKHIQDHIEKWLPNASLQKKAARYDKIAKKILKIKYEKLERRITSDLAKATKEVINESPDTPNLEGRLTALFEDIEFQAKVKIVAHTLLLLAITVSLVGTILATGGLSGLPIMIAVAATVTVLVGSNLLIRYGIVNRAAVNLYDRLEKIKNGIEDDRGQFLAKLVSLEFYQNVLRSGSSHHQKPATDHSEK